MDELDYDALNDAVPRARRKVRSAKPAPMREAARRTPLAPDAPAPRLRQVIGNQGYELTERALGAWNARIAGVPLIDVAHELGISIDLCKKLIREVHDAIRDDLKESLDLNRTLDLERVDGLVNTFYPQARAGDAESAAVVIRCLQHRSKLTGIEPLPDPGRSHPENVMIWIQNQMPSINRLVDSLPVELP